MMLLEVFRPEEAEARARFVSSWMKAAFTGADYRAEITALNALQACGRSLISIS